VLFLLAVSSFSSIAAVDDIEQRLDRIEVRFKATETASGAHHARSPQDRILLFLLDHAGRFFCHACIGAARAQCRHGAEGRVGLAIEVGYPCR